jgi:hypothetical protein
MVIAEATSRTTANRSVNWARNFSHSRFGRGRGSSLGPVRTRRFDASTLDSPRGEEPRSAYTVPAGRPPTGASETARMGASSLVQCQGSIAGRRRSSPGARHLSTTMTPPAGAGQSRKSRSDIAAYNVGRHRVIGPIGP